LTPPPHHPWCLDTYPFKPGDPPLTTSGGTPNTFPVPGVRTSWVGVEFKAMDNPNEAKVGEAAENPGTGRGLTRVFVCFSPL